MNYSVLMAVYYKDDPIFFKESIDSILNQSVLTDDFVLVCDGDLTLELDNVLKEYQNLSLMNVIRLKENKGLGNALNIGLTHCKNELVARMDSDDISLSNRCELQVNEFKSNNNLSVISGTIVEFEPNLEKKISNKRLPRTNKDIRKYAKNRNPINHPCVMFKKSDVLESGGYLDFYLYEDYFLWIRMLNLNFEFYNLEDELLHMRAGINQIKRRGGYKYFKSGKRLQRYMLDIKYIGYFKYLSNNIKRFIVQVLLPNKIRENLYKHFLRK